MAEKASAGGKIGSFAAAAATAAEEQPTPLSVVPPADTAAYELLLECRRRRGADKEREKREKDEDDMSSELMKRDWEDFVAAARVRLKLPMTVHGGTVLETPSSGGGGGERVRTKIGDFKQEPSDSGNVNKDLQPSGGGDSDSEQVDVLDKFKSTSSASALCQERKAKRPKLENLSSGEENSSGLSSNSRVEELQLATLSDVVLSQQFFRFIPPDLVKFWEGDLFVKIKGLPAFITKLDGRCKRRESQILAVAADLPATWTIDYFTNENYSYNNGVTIGRPTVWGQLPCPLIQMMRQKKLCAVIKLPCYKLVLRAYSISPPLFCLGGRAISWGTEGKDPRMILDIENLLSDEMEESLLENSNPHSTAAMAR